MLSSLTEFADTFGPLRLFGYTTFRALGAAITAFILGLAIAPFFIARLADMKQALRTKAQVGKLADLHAAKKGTPTMGGLIIFVAVVVTVLLWTKMNLLVGLALTVYTGLTLIGYADDYLKIVKKSSDGLASHYKLVGQALLVVLVIGVLAFASTQTNLALTQLWVPFVREPFELPLWAMALFFFLVLAGTSNAINLTDGMDGLAIGCTITNAMVFALMAYVAGNTIMADYLNVSYVPGSQELAIFLAALLGASMAFLWHNAHPASIFMGDTGSLAIGGLLGTIAFLIHQPLVLVIVGGIFVIEAGSVLLQMVFYKATKGRRFFRMAPIHHHFELGGWPETKVVIRFWIVSLMFALLGLATLKLR